MLMEIATLAQNSSIDLHISVFVTCLCNPESIAPIPNCTVTLERPSVGRMMDLLLEDKDEIPHKQHGQGLALAISGPESLTREARNAVAGMSLASRRRVGDVAIHTEVFAI